jgi:HAD superfamily hydrolase (TIGR01459 family)
MGVSARDHPEAPTDAPRWIAGLREVAGTHGGWVFDQYGVLHDGTHAYAGAADVLRRLKRRGDCVIVLSNSGKRAEVNRRRLERFGFGADCLDAVLTSGELVHDMLAARDDPLFAALGPRCRLISNDADVGVIDGLPIQAMGSALEADFILLCGTAGASSPSAFDAEFASAARCGVPAICANPDFMRFDAGRIVTSCGAIAHRYEQLGGTVRWIGKPYPEVYLRCRELLGGAAAVRTVMVGDSLEHDVAGANGAGWTSVLLTRGIHADRLAGAAPAAQRAALLQALCGELGLSRGPHAALDELQW